jgi:hypothetical protein
MSVTITLREELADGLARQAQGRRMSLEEWATRILEAAVSADRGKDAWACEPQDRKLLGRLSVCEEQADCPSAQTHE